MALINEGNTSYVPWEMSEQGVNYFDEVYKNNPLTQIYTGDTPLLNPKQFVPFYRDMDLTDEEMEYNYQNYSGYTYPNSEELYISNLDMAGAQALQPAPLAPFVQDTSSGASEHVQKMIHEAKYNKLLDDVQQEQEWLDSMSYGLARTGTHETIHSNIFDRDKGVYPNAIKEMLRGTSALGVPGGNSRYLGTRTYEGSPHVDRSTYSGHQYYTPNYEQDELFTQQLTGLMHNPPNSSTSINASLPYMLYRDMDRPGQGPLGQEGMERLLRERSEPFYNQILSDAEAGYVQPSIWSGISEPLSSKSAIPTPSRSILSSEENIDINNQRQNELDKRAALMNQFAQIERGRHAVAIEDPIDYKMNADNSATMPYTHYNSKAANYSANVRPEYYFK